MKSPLLICLTLATLLIGCGEKPQLGSGEKHSDHQKHEHRAPHGGTAVELGEEEFHLELVLNAAEGKLQAFVLDGEMEQFIRIPAEAFEVSAKLSDKQETLVFRATASSATGEKVGDTSLFETQADWLKTTSTFDGNLRDLTIRGKTYRDVAFNFPKGNDEKAKQ